MIFVFYLFRVCLFGHLSSGSTFLPYGELACFGHFVVTGCQMGSVQDSALERPTPTARKCGAPTNLIVTKPSELEWTDGGGSVSRLDHYKAMGPLGTQVPSPSLGGLGKAVCAVGHRDSAIGCGKWHLCSLSCHSGCPNDVQPTIS